MQELTDNQLPTYAPSRELNYRMIDKDGRAYVEVPLPLHIRNYFLQEYGQGCAYIKGTLNGFLAGILLMMVEKQPYRQVNNRRRLPGKKLRIMLPERLRRATVPESTIYGLNIMLTNFFQERFLAYVDGATSSGCSDNAAVEQFIKQYDISPDCWSVDSARKYWRDNKFRTKKKRNGFVLQM